MDKEEIPKDNEKIILTKAKRVRKPMSQTQLDNLAKARQRGAEVRAEKATMRKDIKLAKDVALRQEHSKATQVLNKPIERVKKQVEEEEAPPKKPYPKKKNPEYTSSSDEEVVIRKRRPKKRVVYIEEEEPVALPPPKTDPLPEVVARPTDRLKGSAIWLAYKQSGLF